MLKKFESGFEPEEIEITVLLKEKCNGAAVWDEWLQPSVNFIASIDNDTGELVKQEGRLEWLIRNNPDRNGWGFDFKQYGIYRLLVRKAISKELAPYESAYMNNRYMLIKILEEDVQNDKLLELKEELSKPVIIDTPYGKFELDRSMSWFEAEVECGGYTFTAYLETDEDNGDTADGACEAFIKALDDFENFDKSAKEFAAENLVDLANDWLESDEENEEDEPEPITEEKFIEAIEISEMTVSPDGSMSLFYSDGDMFWGHVINITTEEDGTFSDADIAG